MKFSWPLKKHNEGASLVAVLSAVIFVMTIGAIIMTVTVTNIRMREVEESGKVNFYGADGIMEELSAGLNDKASQAMRDAYTTILSDYRNSLMNGVNVQEKFTYLYMDNLKTMFCNESEDKIVNSDASGNMIYVYGRYREDDIKAVMSTENQPYFRPVEETTFSADYVDGLFTLHNLRVQYVDTRGYETIISTDMVFHTPTLNFGNNNEIKEFMKYALIADVQINVDGHGSAVNGSMYAGYDGINIQSNATGTNLVGSNIVSRGDIILNAGATDVHIGNERSSVWAENVTMTSVVDSTADASLWLNGNVYVADDLTLNAVNSKVTLEGNYYGYNFRKLYDGLDTTNSAEYSSAIVINGKNASLDMTNLNYLMLAGRTYISRGINDRVNDVVLGESLSVRTNQLAYYVPERFLEEVSGKMTLVFDSGDDEEESNKAAKYADYINIDVVDLQNYLNAANPVLEYRFRDNSADDPTTSFLSRYYLNFKDEQAANDFFTAYSANNSARINNLGDDYADAIVVGDGMMYSFKGDVMLRASSSSDYTVKSVVIQNVDWDPGIGTYYIYANQMAKNYMSYQRYLEDWSMHTTDIGDANIRFADKADDPVTDYFLDFSQIVSGSRTEVTDGNRLIAVVGNDPHSTPYPINPTYTEGIVIATGNVNVQNDFTGMIIAGGTIQLLANGVEVNADEMLVAELFKEDAEKETPVFSHLFTNYGNSEENVLGLVNIDRYQSYENWTRTEN